MGLFWEWAWCCIKLHDTASIALTLIGHCLYFFLNVLKFVHNILLLTGYYYYYYYYYYYIDRPIFFYQTMQNNKVGNFRRFYSWTASCWRHLLSSCLPYDDWQPMSCRSHYSANSRVGLQCHVWTDHYELTDWLTDWLLAAVYYVQSQSVDLSV